MVTQDADTAERYIRFLLLELSEVRELVEEWPTLPAEAQASIVYDWSVNLGGYWAWLSQAMVASPCRLTDEQRATIMLLASLLSCFRVPFEAQWATVAG